MLLQNHPHKLPDLHNLCTIYILAPFQCFGELCGIAADLNGDALDSGCHLRNHLLAGMKKAHLHGADRLKMGIKIPCQLSPAGLIRIFTCKGLPALSAELHLALVPEEVHL